MHLSIVLFINLMQKKEWLKQALESMHKDPVKIMIEDIKILQEEDSEDNMERKESALSDLQMLCEDIDNARGTYILY